MHTPKLLIASIVGAFVLAACAQQEENPQITVEPMYTKYGAASCPSSDPYLTTDQYGRQTCSSQCEEGYSNATSNYGQLICVPGGCRPGYEQVAGARPGLCVPINDDDPDPQRPGGGPNDPTTGRIN